MLAPARAIARAILRDRAAGVATEYAVLLAVLVLGVFAAVSGVAGETVAIWSTVTDQTSSAVSSTG